LARPGRRPSTLPFPLYGKEYATWGASLGALCIFIIFSMLANE
jgi:hypothetical protein